MYQKQHRLNSYRSKYCVLSIDDYIRERLVPEMNKFKEKLPMLIFARNVLRTLVITLTAFTTFLVAIAGAEQKY